MTKRIVLLLVSIAFLMASCQAGVVPAATGTDIPETGTARTDLPSETPEVAPASTSTLKGETEPAPTDRPSSSTSQPRCFLYSAVSSFAFMPDGVRILIREGAGVRIFDLEKMEDETFLQAPQDLVTAALSPDGEILAWSLVDNSIQLIRLADGQPLKTMKAHAMPVLKMRFSPTGDRLFSASYDSWIRVWDRAGEALDAIQPAAALDFPSEIEGIGISPDGRLLGSIPFDGPAKIYDLTTKKEVADLGGTGGDVSADIDFSPDGEFVAADQLGRLSLWRTSDWKLEWTGVASSAFAFSPDPNGRFLAYADAEDHYNVHLRSLTQPEETRRLERDGSMIWDMFFSPDGRLLTGVGAGLQIWDVDSGELSYVGKAACP